MRVATVALTVVILSRPVGGLAAQAPAQIRVTAAAVVPGSVVEEAARPAVASVVAVGRSNRFGVGFLIGAAVGAGIGALIQASGNGEEGMVVGFAALGAVVGGFVGLSTLGGGEDAPAAR